VHGASIANQWNLANGRAGNGTDYGLIDGDNGKRSAQYYAMRLWTTAGNTLLPLTSPLPDSTTLSTYATRHADGSYSILAINKTGAPIDVRIDLAGVTTPMTVSADVLEADSLEATDVRYNGRADPKSDFSNAPSKALGVTTGPFDYAVPRYSVTVIRFKP
jgi:alpha-L-arabinofuranosidase